MNTFLKLAKIVVVLIIFSAIAISLYEHNTERPRVLIVHSYNKDLAWVNEINDGLERAMKAESAPALNVRTHYMNLKNHPDCNFFKNATADVRFTIDDWKPDVVILVDDLAQALVGFNQLNVTPGLDRDAKAEEINLYVSGSLCDAPALSYFGLDKPASEPYLNIVFAGVNGEVTNYWYDEASNVSGIFEHKSYQALRETLVTLKRASHTQVDSIRMINDNSLTAETENRKFDLQDWGDLNALPAQGIETEAQWHQAVFEANEANTLLIITNYHNVTDEQSETVPGADLIAWTEQNALLPVLGANTSFVADGGMMTVAISGTEQGQVAMELAIARLAGDASKQYREAKQFVIGMNQSLVRKRDLDLPNIYEAFSREVGQFVYVVDNLYLEQEVAQ